MKRKLTALLLCLVLCVGLFGTASAASVTVSGESAGTRVFIRDQNGVTVTDIVLDAGGTTEWNDISTYADSNNVVHGYKLVAGEQVAVNIQGPSTPPTPDKPVVKDDVAQIGDQKYTSLQDAVNAVANNGTLKVLKSGLSATVSKEIVFTIELADGVTEPTITAGDGYELVKDGLKYTVTKSSGGGGGGGGGGSSGGGGGGGSSTSSGYVVSVPSSVDNGTVKVSPSHATEGKKVTITATPDEGYVVGKIIVTDKDGNEIEVTDEGDGKYTFTMPKGKVDVKVEFVEEQAIEPVSFDDVPADAWYTDAVSWAVAKGITTGTGDNKFSPDMLCTRAQVVTFLWRAAGSPEATGTNPFTDVAEGTYYYDAVLWAVEKGITVGTSATTFSPDTVCTRAQIVTFLWRYEGTPEATATSSFADVAEGAWYYDAVNWAVEKEVTLGTGANAFSPDAACTRAQTVTFLYRDMA